ncbi:Glutathione peroxidase [Trachipleistophora hominis]|uniref:Glutathione peroxidase n=1 Tax=Trachipleistophora hominis TaxID=72359 RepID=L7JVF8_TRAHO|nr:Glutathione peroxidase [Trachipleistophora hominis]
MRKVSKEFYALSAMKMDGKEYKFEELEGSVVLIINSATKCGMATTTFENLVALAKRYHDKNLKILIFPCSQFRNQELMDSNEIMKNIEKYSKEFIVFEKVDVKGDNIHPVFKFLTKHLKGTITDNIKWNFTKFLIDQNGIPTKRYGPMEPVSVDDPIIEDLLSNN